MFYVTFSTIIIIIKKKKLKRSCRQAQSHSEALGIKTSTRNFRVDSSQPMTGRDSPEIQVEVDPRRREQNDRRNKSGQETFRLGIEVCGRFPFQR